jgi:hypothetical protein
VNKESRPLAGPVAVAFGTLPGGESALSPEGGALIGQNMITLGRDGLKGLESLGIASDIVQQRKYDNNG